MKLSIILLIFLSTLSLRRATERPVESRSNILNFYPRSPCGERRVWTGGLSCDRNFYPRSPCGERREREPALSQSSAISIHALLAESDTHPIAILVGVVEFLSTLSLRRATIPNNGTFRSTHNFYPRSPCGERPAEPETTPSANVFLSTLSLRRATPGKIRIFNDIFYFYPRSPCGERLGRVVVV